MSIDYYDALPAWTRPEYAGVGRNAELVNRDDPRKWSGDTDPPAIGATVAIRINNIGKGEVLRYFAQDGWLGVVVRLANPPEWYVKQNGADALSHAFGAELGEVAP